MIRGNGHPRWLASGAIRELSPVDLSDRTIDEDWLQERLDRYPDLLPIDEIGRSWGPLISLGREIPVASGSVDNLFISPTGELTIVEAKLWRNPEARRKVVGQILEYAAAFALMGYEDLDSVIDGPQSEPGSLWKRVCASTHAPGLSTEADFIDTVTRNLRAGRFLLLVVGDGIREDLDGVADLLRQHPGLRFHLELIEMRLYRDSRSTQDDLLVVPSMVGRSAEVQRAVIDVATSSSGAVTVNVVAPLEPETPKPGARRYKSLGEFSQRCSDSVSADFGDFVTQLATWWQQEHGGIIRLNETSITLAMTRADRSRSAVAVLAVYDDGSSQGCVQPIVATHQLGERDEVLSRFGQAGFEGGDRYPTRSLAAPIEEQMIALTSLLDWVVTLVRAADQGERQA